MRNNTILAIAQDNRAYTHWPPIGLMHLAWALRARGKCLIIANQQVTHVDARVVGGEIRRRQPGAVMLSWTAGPVPHRMALDLAAEVPADIPIVAGGHGPSGGAAWYREHLRPSGLVEVVEGMGRSEVLDLDCDIDPDDIPPGELLEGWPVDYYAMVRAPRCEATDRVWPVLTARGCPGRCTFCYRLDRQWRARDLDRVGAEVEWLAEHEHITYVQLQDECALASVRRAHDVAEMMRGRVPRWSTQGTVRTIAHGGERLCQALAESGCLFVNLGIESLSAEALRLMGKRHTPEEATAAVRYLREAGVSPGLNLIWPMPGDTSLSLAKATAFIAEYTDGAQLRTIRPPTPWPGCALWDQAVENGVFTDVGDFYARFRGSDISSMPVGGMRLSTIDGMLRVANWTLLTKYHTARLEEQLRTAVDLYDGRLPHFRGWRQT